MLGERLGKVAGRSQAGRALPLDPFLVNSIIWGTSALRVGFSRARLILWVKTSFVSLREKVAWGGASPNPAHPRL